MVGSVIVVSCFLSQTTFSENALWGRPSLLSLFPNSQHSVGCLRLYFFSLLHVQMEVRLLQAYIIDLSDQNTILIQTVEELENQMLDLMKLAAAEDKFQVCVGAG